MTSTVLLSSTTDFWVRHERPREFQSVFLYLFCQFFFYYDEKVDIHTSISLIQKQKLLNLMAPLLKSRNRQTVRYWEKKNHLLVSKYNHFTHLLDFVIWQRKHRWNRQPNDGKRRRSRVKPKCFRKSRSAHWIGLSCGYSTHIIENPFNRIF